MERTEWQVAPASGLALRQGLYELIAASALLLRVVGPRPGHDQLARAETLIAELLNRCAPECVLCVPRHGWLIWNAGDARHAFLDALRLRDALIDRLSDIERCFRPGSRLRWGVMTDLFVLRCSERAKVPCITAPAATAMFGFEPDNAFLVSPAVFHVNRRWEDFVGVYARRRDDSRIIAYAPLGHKRPSALDHFCVTDKSAFVGRTTELQHLEEAWQSSRTTTTVVAVIAPAGTGKTRLVRQWVQSHADANARYACFSIFGGDLEDFVAQLGALPDEHATLEALLDGSIKQIERCGIQVLVLDDLHWADQEAWRFLRRFQPRLPAGGVLAVLATRPAAQAEVLALFPHVVIQLDVLPETDLAALARRLCPSSHAAARATELAQGNPLFVEQFAAWAVETGFGGDSPCPASLHDLVMARIRHIETGTLQGLRQRIAWTPRWMRADLDARFAAVETEIGLWLDRLETGDYGGDAVRLLDYLELLRRVEFELFMAANLSGRPRPRSTRLRESIDRLVAGNGNALLDNLQGRAAVLQGREDRPLAQQAEWIAEYARETRRWPLARACLELASAAAEGWQQARLREHAATLGRLLGDDEDSETADPQSDIVEELERCPAVDPTSLAERWYRLGKHYGYAAYYARALEAAAAVGATGWASRARAALARSAGAA